MSAKPSGEKAASFILIFSFLISLCYLLKDPEKERS